MNYRLIMSDVNNLYDGLLRSIKSSSWKESSQKAALFFLDMIYRLSDDLYYQTYRTGEETHFILHERGRVRPITSLNVRDRTVRHVLCDYILMPRIRPKIIYDNSASIEDRGISFARKRLKVHLQDYYHQHGTNRGYILLGDFSKFYDNILHEPAKKMLLDLVDGDEYIEWLLDILFKNFEIDASAMSDEEYFLAKYGVFNKLEYHPSYRYDHPVRTITKSINIGDQLAQAVGIYYPHELDNYVKIVKSTPYYARYMDDWYIISPDKAYLHMMLDDITERAHNIGLTVNRKKTRIVPINQPFVYLQTTHRLTETGAINISINSDRVAAMRVRLKKLVNKVNAGQLPYHFVESMFRSWMGSFHSVMSKYQIDNLISLYESLFTVYVEIQNGSMYIEGENNGCTC